jgi:hypothetical protein
MAGIPTLNWDRQATCTSRCHSGSIRCVILHTHVVCCFAELDQRANEALCSSAECFICVIQVGPCSKCGRARAAGILLFSRRLRKTLPTHKAQHRIVVSQSASESCSMREQQAQAQSFLSTSSSSAMLAEDSSRLMCVWCISMVRIPTLDWDRLLFLFNQVRYCCTCERKRCLEI